VRTIRHIRLLRQPSQTEPIAWIAALGLLVCLGLASPLRAQFSTGPIELSGSINLDQADSAVRAHLERVRAYVVDRQWDEAVETLRQVMESHGTKMIPLAPSRFVNLADYCHVQLASLPPEALELYRDRVDALAEQWYREGLARRSTAKLSEVIEKMFCSSWGDDALWALGEIELEKGNHGAARRAWERLIEVPPARIPIAIFTAARERAGVPPELAALLDRSYAIDSSDAGQFYRLRADDVLSDETTRALVQFWKAQQVPATRLAYPGTTLPLADVRARLILVSIMEGSLDRARDELRAFEQLHPGAEGRLAGRQGKYAAALAGLVTAAENWPGPKASENWSTFAGAFRRTKVAPRNLDLGPQAWPPISLGEPLSADVSNSRAYSLRRVGEDAQRLLSYHPLLVGELVLYNDQGHIFAFNAKTGTPAWPRDDPKRLPGEIFADDNAAIAGRTSGRLGVPRFTMTAHRGKLYARMGSQVTSRPLESLDGRASGYLVCLDLAAEGKLDWKLTLDKPDEEKWAFEGSPVVDGTDLYVAMRKSDVRPQAHVACFDLQTRRLRWRTMVCAAESPSGGQTEEITHNLLTLEQGTIYYNTNLGAVGALSARDGRLHWATLYPRAKKAGPDGEDKRTAHFYRDLNPCVYYRGMLFVAPSDCESIFALDAGSGELKWESQLPEDAVHLLGVGRGNLLASGDALWWIDAQQGKVVRRWPDTTPLGHGRGILMGDRVVWPTAGEIYVFDLAGGTSRGPLRDPISLSERGAAGGNLVAGGGLLLIATPEKLFGFRQQGEPPRPGNASVVTDRRAKTPPPKPAGADP
jgi:outer membrane protein assembly factor BamB